MRFGVQRVTARQRMLARRKTQESARWCRGMGVWRRASALLAQPLGAKGAAVLGDASGGPGLTTQEAVLRWAGGMLKTRPFRQDPTSPYYQQVRAIDEADEADEVEAADIAQRRRFSWIDPATMVRLVGSRMRMHLKDGVVRIDADD